ncbi:MAG: 6-bladed beta-propeller [Gammaproteobacteria bacterium]|nr:6-bladed beta-propeller [Gammaproteobacteria bacterium]
MNRIIMIGLAALLISGCAAPQKTVTDGQQVSEIIWPAPPLKPRIKYLYQFAKPIDLEIEQSLLSRIWGWLSGRSLSTGMVRPYSIAVKDQLVAVADPGKKTVHLFNTSSSEYQQISQADETYFSSPVGVAIGNDQIYISDSKLAKIFVFTKDAEFVRTIEGLKRPTGLYFDNKNKKLYVSDTLDHQIVVYNSRGQKQFSFGQRKQKEGDFNFPSHLALDNDKLYVNDTMNFRIQTFALDGKYVSSFGKHGDASGYFSQPKGIGVDSKGHIYVVDAIFHRVQIFDNKGRYLMDFGNQGRGPGEFWLPSGLFIDQDKIYVADSYNRRVQVFQYVGG